MKKIFVSIAAAGVLVAGAFAASMIVDGQALAQTDDSPVAERPDIPTQGDILGEVLGALVADGTLDQGQADAVKAALEAKHEEVRAQFGEWREDHPARFERDLNMGGIFEDGVVDADELADLPDDHPLKDPDGPAAEFLDDGELSTDDLRELGRQRHPHRGGGRVFSSDA